MKELSIIIVGLLLSWTVALGQDITIKGLVAPEEQPPIPSIKWMSWEEAMERSATEPRKIIVDIYTVWCTWCDKMDEYTFSDPEIAHYINERFYPVKFDAEQKIKLKYKDKEYGYSKAGKRSYHDLAKELMGGRFSFPTIVFLDEELNVIQCVAGFKTPQQFQQITIYFADDHYRKVPWSTFRMNYQPTDK